VKKRSFGIRSDDGVKQYALEETYNAAIAALDNAD
jgi:hypothetical protein